MRLWPTPKPAVLAAVTILDDAFGQYASVATNLPSRNWPDRLVKVSRVGGGQSDLTTDNARLLVECYAKTTAEVEAMCNTARAALRNSGATWVECVNGTTTERIFVRGWGDEQGPIDFPHPDVPDRERWQLHGDLAVKAN